MTDIVGIDYTLLVDETGVDGNSKRAMYVGCLVETAELESIKNKIIDFNKACLDDPFYSNKPGLVNSEEEARHFVDDNEALRSRFIEKVLHNIACRVYVVFGEPKATIRETKVELFKVFIRFVRQVREIRELGVVIERSGADDKYLEKCGAEFKTKEFLPLCIADYYGAVLHRFHEKRLEKLSEGSPLKRRELNGLAFGHYAVLVNRISLEVDITTREKSSRRYGRYFLKQIEGIVVDD